MARHLLLLGVIVALIQATVITGVTFAGVTAGINWKREFDDKDRLLKLVDPAGSVTRFDYHADSKSFLQVAKVSPDGRRVVWQFDNQSSPTSMTDGMGKVVYSYDGLGRLSRVQREGRPELAYTYDTMNRITDLQVGDFYKLDYTYDFLGRLSTMNTPAGAITYEYLTGQGLWVRTLPNGVQTIWEFEPDGQLRKITHINTNDNNLILAQYLHQYRTDGLIEAISEYSPHGKFATLYEYDKMGRLVRAADQLGREYNYQYDKMGNRLQATQKTGLSQVCTFDWAGRLTNLNENPCEHDPIGNLISATNDQTVTTYGYNSDGLLQKAGGNVTYHYDGDGRLIKRQVGKRKMKFTSEPFTPYWQPLVMEDDTGHRSLIVWEGSTPLVMIRNNKPEYMLHDHLGSVRLVVDERGKVVQKFDYDPFGVILDSTPSSDFAPRYAGLFWDEQAQAYLTPLRPYSPAIGRFLGPDPTFRIFSESKHSHSVYAYCGGDPVNFIDLDGAEAEPISVRRRQIFQGTINEVKRDPGWSFEFLKSFYMENVESLRFANNFWTNFYNEWSPAVRSKVFWKDFFGKWGLPIKKGNERDFVISEVINNSLALANDVTEADLIVRAWRGHKAFYRYEGAIIPTPVNLWEIEPTENEWQAAENYMYARKYVMTGKGHRMFEGIHDKDKSIDAAVSLILWKIPVWSYAHFWGESLGINPNAILSASAGRLHTKKMLDKDEKGWIAQTQKTIEWQNRGVIDGLVSIEPQIKVYRPSNQKGDKGRFDDDKGCPRTIGTVKSGQVCVGPVCGPPALGWQSGGVPGSGVFFSKMSPSTVGGVYLGGAGQALEGLGSLKGFALDANNNLILLGREDKAINLPPLRLDDVVTVFQSVYIHGEGPKVTIDPNPQNPDGSAMIISHGKATENTYVGWILYQADRLMKGYTIGTDNITVENVTSAVPDYAEVLDSLYFGEDTPEQNRQSGRWERFWIVPSRAHRFEAPRHDLTLFDVPLKVKTQLMKWEHSKLVNDPHGKSSEGALKFIDWFTREYDAISREQFLTPPVQFGIDGRVPVFTELRRLALLTAIAEKLRDQGIPMPFWMRYYEVRRVPFEKTTPGIRETRSNGKSRAQVFGGVNLSPDTREIKLIAGTEDLVKLPASERLRGKKTLKIANSLSAAMQKLSISSDPMNVHRLWGQNGNYNAMVIPGTETLALAPCRLDEIDLAVPIEGGREIRLMRSYHSFFRPSGPWGKGWSLDLPRLEKIRVPIERKDDTVRYKTAYELITPLNSIYARFSTAKRVPALNNSRLQVPDQVCGFFGLADGNPSFLSAPTLKLLAKDGTIWHFTKAGDLAAYDKDGFRTVFARKTDGTVSQIAGLLGTRLMATIDLHYDSDRRIVGAKGRNAQGEQTIRYVYNTDHKLAEVISDQGKRGYQYQGPWVTAVSWNSSAMANDEQPTPQETMHRYEYNSNGQLISESLQSGERITYKITSDLKGNSYKVIRSGKATFEEVVHFDKTYQPTEALYADGTKASWTYPQNGERILRLKNTQGEIIQITESGDGRRLTYDFPGRPRVTEEYDENSRLTAMTLDGRNVFLQHWHPNGTLRSIESENSVIQLQYDQDSLLTARLLHASGEQGRLQHWQRTKLDHTGRPVEVTDYRGLQITIRYNANGDIDQVISARKGKNYGFQVHRDQAGRVQIVESSWGKAQYFYDEDGHISMMAFEKLGGSGMERAVLTFESGRLHGIKEFDGGETSISYYKKGPQAGLTKQISCAKGLDIDYRYNSSGDLMWADIDKRRRIALDYDTKGRIVRLKYRRPGWLNLPSRNKILFEKPSRHFIY
jgi:RHS repeat-associated protein